MPIFPEDISNQLGGGGELPSIPRLSEPYTGAPKQTKIPSYFEPGTPIGGGGREAASYDEIVRALSLKQSPLSATQTQITPNELLGNYRYSLYRPGVNWEDIYGQNQSTWEKSVNGVLKGVNLVGTTILGGFGVLGGALISPFTGRLADIWDNQYLNALDEWNTKVDQEGLPNYYTNAEKNAAWYSTGNWFTANFLFDKLIKNSGYAVGALISGNMANAALLGTGARAGAAAMRLATAAESSQAFKAFTPLLRNTARAFSVGKNLEAAAVLEGEISSAVDLTAKASRLTQIANETNTFAKFGDLGRRTAVAAYSSAGEASFEALQTSKEFRNNLIEQYKESHLGIEPTGEDLKKINEYAESVGKTSFFTNLALLSVTEYVQLNYLLGSSYRKSREAANNMLRKTDDVVLRDSKYAVEAPTTKFGKLYNRVTGTGRYIFDPKEAFQELAQYATQIGTQNYFNKAYEGNEADVLLDGVLYGFMGKDKRGAGVGALVSKEGMESMLLGGLTGGPMQAMQKYSETKATQGNTQRLINELNNAPTFRDALKDKINGVNRGVVLQQQHRDATLQDDKLEATDLKTDLTYNYLAPRIKYGRTDLIKADIAELRTEASTEEGLSTLKDQGIANMNDTIPSFIERLNEFSDAVNTASSIYESLYLRYGGKVLQDGKTPAYPDEVIDKMTYAAVKVADYDKRIPLLNNALFATGVDANELLKSVVSEKGVDKEIEEKTFAQIEGMSITEDAKESLRTTLEDVVELTKRRKLFLDEYNDMKENPLKYAAKPTKGVDPSTQETITIKTKDGEEKIAIGERYVGGAKEIETEEGIKINRFTEFDVMGTTEDGKIVLKTLDGKIHNVSPKAFEEYKLSRSADIGRNAKFYIDNSEKIFNYRFKGGKESQGRVVYDKITKGLFFESIERKKNGKPVYRIPVKLSQFETQEGYSRAQIWSKEKFSEKTNDILRQAPTAEEAEVAANLEQKLNARRAIIKEITDDAKEQIEDIDKKIVEKKDALTKINNELEDLREVSAAEPRTKREKALEAKYPELSRQKARFAKVFSKTSRALLKLSRLKDTLESEIADLQTQKDILEANTAYFEDFLQNVQELPENVFDLVDELKDQVNNLKDLTKSTGTQINQLLKLSDDINETLRDLTEWLKDSLGKFDSQYPLEIRQRIEDIIASKTISYTEINALKDAISDYAIIEDLNKEITINQDKLNDITTKLQGLMNSLDEIGKEQRAKELILNKFEDLVQKELQRIKEEKAITKDAAVIKQILGTLNQGVQNKEYERTYEPDPKMSAVAAATSTTAPTERSFAATKEDVAEHHARANRFGARMPNLPNAGDIKGVIVTSETESQIINGLTNHLKQGKEEIKAKTTIALVMAIPSKDGKSYTLVDENGVPIPEKSEAESDLDYQNRLLNTAIYQTFPINIESRLRDTVPQEVRMQFVNSYEEWRKEKLDEKTLKNYDIRPSFGFTEKVQKPTANGLNFETDYDTRVAVQESGLIRETELGSRRLVYVPTVEQTISLGSTAFGNALGRTFLVTKNGYVPLDNRQHTAEEAEVIHQVLVRLSEIIAEENTKGKFVYDNSPEAQRLVNWLRSVTYWGTPKEAAGFNSVWFQKTEDGLKLFMSGKVNEEGKYTPVCEFGATALTENKGIITGALQKMYQNTNAKATDENYYNERYEQITGVNNDGSVSFVMWPNYQTYLLSGKNADGTGTRQNVPLTTNIRPLKSPEDVNKYGIYFTIAENNVDKRFTDIAPEGKAITINPAGAPAVKGKFDLEGKENAIKMKNGVLRFTVDGKDLEGTITILDSTDQSLIDFLIKQQEDAGKVADIEAVINTLSAYALGEVRKDLTAAAEKAKAAPAAPTAPAGKFNLDGKTENTVTLKNGSFKFTAEKDDLEGTMVVTSADDNLVNSLIEAQIASGNPSDRDVIINTLGAFAVNEAKKDLASLAQAPVAPAPAAAPVSDAQARKDKAIASIQKVTDGWRAVADDLGGASADEIITDTREEVIKLIDEKYKDELAALEGAKPTEVSPAAPIEAKLSTSTAQEFSSKTQPFYKEALALNNNIAIAINEENAEQKIQSLIDKFNQSIAPYQGWKLKASLSVPFDTLLKLKPQDRASGTDISFSLVPVTNENYSPAKKGANEIQSFGEMTSLLDAASFDKASKAFIKEYNRVVNNIKVDGKVGIPNIDFIDNLFGLKGAKPAETVTKDENQQLNDAWNATEGTPDDPEEYRVILDDGYLETEDFAKFEEFLKRAFPILPVYRVKNMMRNGNGVRAMGMFKKAGIYLWESAEIGTGYHEVFEAVWKMFTTPQEQQAIRDEFRNRSGQFKDRPSGQMVKYSEATDQQIKEQLAEEFRSYIKDGVIPPKPVKAKPFILKLFADIWSAIKTFVIGPSAQSNTEKLFEKINKGYYKRYTQMDAPLAYANVGIIDIENATITDDAELSEIPGLTNSEVHDFMQQMTFLSVGYLTRDNKNLFNISSDLKKTDVYGKVQANLRERFKKIANTEKERVKNRETTQEAADLKEAEMRSLFNKMLLNWDGLTEAHEIYLRKYGIEFDENDEMNAKDENRSNRGEYEGAHKVDHFRKMNSAVRLVLATMPILDNKGNAVLSSIGGVKLMPVGETYISLMNRVHDSVDADDMMERIREMAKEDTNYETLYRRLAKTSSDNLPNWDSMEAADIQLITAFSTQFTKQNPDVKILNILPEGGIQVGEANLTAASRQLEKDYVNGIKTIAMKPGNKFFEYVPKEKAYIAKAGAFDKVNLTENPATYVKFLASIGIEFSLDDINQLAVTSGTEYRKFREATAGVLKSMKERKKIVSFTDQALDIKGRLLTLAGIQARINNPEFSSTFFGINGERLQTFIGTNPSFDLYKELSKFPTYQSLSGHPRFGYLYTDSFAQNSVILNSIFNIDKATKTGDRRQRVDTKEFMRPGIANGTNNQPDGKKKDSSDLNFRERLIQEVNMNLEGYYYNLVAGDAALEYMTYMGNEVKKEDLDPGKTILQDIFKGYLIDEINLSREDRPTVVEKNKDKLRFMDAILGSELANTITADKTSTPEKIYDDNVAKIQKAVDNYINDSTESFKELLTQYNIITEESSGDFTVSNLAFAKTDEMSKEALDRNLKTLTINYMIANIEFHKLLYSDPYMYSDELKRIKNFLSPRQAIVSSGSVNAVLERVMNEGYKKGDIGYTDMTKTYFKSTTIEDVKGFIDLENYGTWDEADGAGIINFKAHRNLRKRSNNWTDADEAQYRYDIAWEKRHKKLPISKAEQKILDKGNPYVKSAYTPIKPIVAGNRADGKSYNDVMLDKLALFPLSYRIAVEMAELAGQETSNAVRLYNKMQAEEIDYAVFKTARKVGGTVTNVIYDDNGMITKEPFKGVITVPFNIMSIQTDVPSKEDNLVTRGSQMTKLVTMDMMESGVPVDFEPKDKNGRVIEDPDERMAAWYAIPSETQKKKESPLYAEIKNNEALLNALTEEGYKLVLKKLGITEKDGKYTVTDFSKAAKTFRDEIFKREVNSNIVKTLADFLDGKAILEATPAYQQVRNILYSIIDKNVTSPKISGGQKVQAPSTFLEDIRAKKEKGGYSSDVLKFYEDKDGKRVSEIMVGRWFDSPLSDKELMDYFNNTEEGKKELAAMFGAAFRIPTGKQNYIEHFKIKQFLPREMGDTVIVPSALVKKVGSDFDIDKLNVYLKNVYVKNGKPKVIPFFGIGEDARQKLQKTILKEDLEGIFKLDQEFSEVYDVSYEALYKKSLENAYIESLEKLISHERNFEQLITPNSSKELKDLSQKITRKLGLKPFESASINDILNRGFMSRLRHAFVTGKYAIGIAAVAQTSHSLSQRQPTFVDTRKRNLLSERDRPWVGDGELKFEKFNKVKVDGKYYTSLSGIKNAAGKYISDIIGQFIDGYVDISKGPWIIELGANPNVAGTFLFLAKAGVPADTLSYFMNQPIIRDYLRSLENAGQTYLFIDDNVDDIKSKYKTGKGQVEKITTIPSTTKLFENIGKTEFDAQENAEQQFILNEFLKYSKLAEQLLMVQQGINYDTSSLNDPLLVFKKNELYKRAQTSMISSASEIMRNSFMGDLRKYINKSKEAVAQFLVSDRGEMQTVLENVLSQYVLLNDRDFLKVAKKTVADLFDWAVQLSGEPSRNTFIQSLLLSDNNAASQVLAFKNEIAQDPKHPLYNNYIIGKNGILQTITPNKEGGPNNISVKNKDNKAYDQDQIIYSFRELRDHLNTVGNLNLYKKIVGVSILQSGISTTPYSFTSLLPYEDFMETYNDAIYKMEMGSELDLNKFYELGVLQRNNWSDDNIVPQQKAKSRGLDMYGNPIYNTNMDFRKMAAVQKAINEGVVPKLLKMSTLSNAGRYDFVSYSWEMVPQGKSKAQMRKEGDFSYIKKGLFKKVYYDKERTKPVITGFTKKMADGTTKTFNSYVYQMVNAWGDSFRANEFYDAVKESVIDNGYEKVTAGQYQVVGSYLGETYTVDMYTSPERDDQAVARLFGTAPVETVAPVTAGTNPQYPGKTEFNKLPGKSVTPTMTYAGIGSRQTPPEVLTQMTEIAKELQSKGYTLNTGKTFGGKEEGADAAFSRGTTNKNLFAPEQAGQKEVAIAKEIHPNPDALTQGAMKLMARNTNQVFGKNLDTPVDFVLFYAKETRSIRPEGGTGQAVEMARLKGIPTINMANTDWREQLNAAVSGGAVSKKIQPKGLPSIDDKNQNSCK